MLDVSSLQETPSTAPTAPALDSPELYFNRELSWTAFNDRVMQLAEDASIPLLERVKFCAIWTSNLDEFFMIRVAGLHDQVDAGLTDPKLDGRTPAETLAVIRENVRGQLARVHRCLREELTPGLAEHNVRIVPLASVTGKAREALEDRYRREIYPVLTPLAVGLGRPFPYISNLSLSLAIQVRDPHTGHEVFARVKVPKEMLPRFVPVEQGPGSPGSHVFVALEEIIADHIEDLFPGMEIVDHGFFRVTRDADFDVSDEADDLLLAIEQELRRRRFGEAVRLEVNAGISPLLREQLTGALKLTEDQVYDVDGPLDLTDLWQLVKLPGMRELRDPPWTPVTQPRLQDDDGERVDMFAEIRRGDILVHHPYDSFNTSVERFVQQAVEDPDVLAIKQTVYRTSDDTPLIPALIRATERGKQAVCLVELKARFDERANITWARELEEAGVHVVYGHPSLKTHAKSILIVRREGNGVRHYVHVGTGNYHPNTARLYTDFGLFTCDEGIGNDVADMFNFLTGFARPRRYRRSLVAPSGLRDGIIERIEQTIAAHEDGKPTRIQLKMNSLVDPACIRALYRASQAGVPVDINTRGICCLRPGVPGVSETIRVISVLGRVLEHSRIFAFHRGDETEVLIGSADLMQRNLDSRVELVVPVLDEGLRGDILDTMERCLADDTGAWELQSDGTWARRARSEPGRSVQHELTIGHAARAQEGRAAGDP